VKLLRAWDDSRTLAALAKCLPDGGGFVPGGGGGWAERVATEQEVAENCGHPGFERDPDIPRQIDSALPMDSATVTHVRAVFARGKALGRRADVFGTVGDSLTIDYNFMKPFSWTGNVRIAFDPRVREALLIDDGRRSIIDFFRGTQPADAAEGESSTYFDSFFTIRAAKIGARANWAVTPVEGKATPLDEMIDSISPAYAVVMYGTNDAEWYLVDPAKVASLFGEQLRRIVDDLEEHGTIPLLTTIPKHMHDKRFADCSRERDAKTNARYVVQTNAVSAEVAAIACERHLPLIDYRYAIDPLLDHGVGGDGVHPTVYSPLGGGMLDQTGLQCGYNVRNLVTLRMLKLVHDVVLGR
jgi:hypothetical protein